MTINKSKSLSKYLVCLFVILFSCDRLKNETIKDVPNTSLKEVYKWINLKIKPKKVLYKIKNRNYNHNKRVDIGPNEVPDSISYLVCVLEYSDKDIFIIKNEIAKNNSIRKIDFIHSKEIYEYWLPVDIKKRFMQSTIKDNLVITNPIFTLNNYFSNSIKPNSLNYDGFCFIEKNYVYIYKVLLVK